MDALALMRPLYLLVVSQCLQKRHERSGMFNLEEDGNEEGLTHFGQSLGDMEKFDDIPLSDEELVEGEAKWVFRENFNFH